SRDRARGSPPVRPRRSGREMSLVLSQIETGDRSEFRHVEAEDMVGLGFHLEGGSRFEVGDACRFETRPLDVWAGTAPRGAASSFSLPEHGFKTVSLRLTPASLRELLQRDGGETVGTGPLSELARRAGDDVAFARLGSLDAATSQLVESMFSTSYFGAARTLFLESCALGLLAHHLDASSRPAAAAADELDPDLMKKLLAAREHLDAHFTDPPTIRELARLVATNEFALKRGFKRAFGHTIFGYIRQRRMQLAASELQCGRSVQEAAQEAGYACRRSFADAFRRHFGMLPSALLRRRAQKAPAPPT
ncbi:MAG: AraC family transcriptional regulator, partial [Acidobacteriota bacterium]